jgi:hypothetical protein
MVVLPPSLPKIKIHLGEAFNDNWIEVNGQRLQGVKSLRVEKDAESEPVVYLELISSEIEIEGEADLIRDAEPVDITDIVEHLMKRLAEKHKFPIRSANGEKVGELTTTGVIGASEISASIDIDTNKLVEQMMAQLKEKVECRKALR